MLKKFKGLTKHNKIFILALSFFLPVIILLLVCKKQGITPFGDSTFAIIDMYQQYLPYFNYFKSLFDGTGFNNLFYSFTPALGVDLWALFTYYLASPINLILLLFSTENLISGIAWVIIVKVGLCGFTFNYFISRKNKGNFKTLIFSTSYALCAYVINYFFNIMWLDAVILLPLIILGIDYIFDKNKYMLYAVSLALALFINYYIGFMLCIFSGIYFIYKFFLTVDSKTKFKLYWKKILIFAFASIIAVALAAVVLLPNFTSIQNGRGEFDFSILTMDANYPLSDTFSKLFTNAFDTKQIEHNGLPQIYCGTFILFMAILYFFNKKITFREKCASAVVLGIFIISFHLQGFNLIWHGLNIPNHFFYRFSFMFCFMLILLAYRTFENLSHNSITLKNLLTVVGIITIVAIWVEKQGYSYIIPKWLYFDCLLALIYAVLIQLYMKFKTAGKKTKNNIILILFIILYLNCFDLFINANYTFEDLKANSASLYSDEISKNNNLINKIKKQDSGLYRTEKTFYYSLNDALNFDYYGISYSGSVYQISTFEFFKRLGFNQSHVWLKYYRGSTTTVDSLLGIKYIATSNNDEMLKRYDFQFKENDYSVYKNPYALSWGYVISNSAYNTNMSCNNTFELQNNMLKDMTSLSQNVYYKASEPIITVENMNISENDNSIKYTKANSSSDAWIEYSINITSTDNLYAEIKPGYFETIHILVNGKFQALAYDTYPYNLIELGNWNVGDTVKLKLILKDNQISINDIFFYYEDLEVLEQHYNKLAKNRAEVVLNSSSSLTATVNVIEDNQTLLLTVPYNTGWSMTVDGVETEPSKIFDALIAVDLPIGKHTVTINYIPEGFNKGLLISFTALLILLISRVVVIVVRNKNPL